MNSKESFAEKVKRLMGISIPSWIPRGKWQGKFYDHILIDIESNFIDGDTPISSDAKGNLTKAKIKYHQGAAHLNSSQVMCISFFKKFFEKADYEQYLLKILRCAGLEIALDEKIEAAVFEYEPDPKERTNFDFYMILTSGRHISFEVKYTEAEFGGISEDKKDPLKYDRKWEETYKEMTSKSYFLSEIGKDAFYKNYQINRNIVYAAAEDYVLFLTPRSNDAADLIAGRTYIDSFGNDHIKNLYWEDVITETLEVVNGCSELRTYFDKFYDKYFSFLA